ncbi:YcjF family protein [Shewanella sp. AS16]|uniref:TIGR01620 family protein n=1 Tax=Shewanella sp. AS16 TaxID=2907625 RepID=UPI001F27D9AA|nr:TIGR01620 family protein [Shewanella sp. AS16]MCE9684974.1 YcjF family protein [Shewanella sp. AS16]
MSELSGEHNKIDLKPQRRFDARQQDAAAQAGLKEAQQLDPAAELLELELAQHEQEYDAKAMMPGTGSGFSRLARLSLAAILVLLVTQTLLALHDAWLDSPWLFGLYAGVLAITTSWAAAGVVSEWRKLKRLKRVADSQASGRRLQQSMQMGEAEGFIAPLLSQYPPSPGQEKFKAALSEEHNDAECLQLFDTLVLSERDRLAKKIVRRYAAQSALLLAASPLALLDMAIILWRNQSMIRDVARCYGIELGYWSRIKLIRSIVINILYAGTSELVTDLGTQLLSVEMTGKLSARLAQGLGGGILTARLGYQAMALCRPLDFGADNKPKLTKIHRELLAELTSFSGQVLSKAAKGKSELRNKDFTSTD